MTTIATPKHRRLGQGFTKRDVLASIEHAGRRTDGSQSAASWILDLVSTRKTLIFCRYCSIKFNPRKHHYRRFYSPDNSGITDGHVVNGMCDGCKQMTVNCGGGTAFVHESTYNLVCIDPVEARRKARLSARRAMSVWDAVNADRGNRGPSEAPVRR